MKELYIANLVKKKEVMSGVYICEVIGPIVGLLFGSHFLSSHSKKYIPMFSKKMPLETNQPNSFQDVDLSKEKFFNSKEEYAYYDCQIIDNYNELENIISNYKKIYEKVCYYIDLSTKVPVLIRYKKK